MAIQSRYKAFGKKLVTLRAARGLSTQGELARLLGVKQQTISRWEAGSSRPRADEIPKLAALLQVDATALSLAAGFSTVVASVSFDRPLPLAALSPDSFEFFSLDLLATLYRGAAVVHPAGKTGHKQHGIDIEAVFADGTAETFQCKREAQFGAAKVHAAIKAQTISARKKFILLSRVASPDARKAIRSAPDWDLWDQVDITRIFRTLPKVEQVRIADIYFPSQRFALTGESAAGPWLTADAFFAPQLAEGRIFNQRWDLIGRVAELDLLSTALADPEVVTVSLIGRAGEGKSRVLRAALDSFAAAHPGVFVRVASPTEEITAKHLENLGTDAKLIVVDDVHDRSDLGQLIRYAADERNNARLILVYRPYWTDVVQRELARAGIAGKLAVAVSLAKPTKQDAKDLASQVLSKHGAPTHAASAIADLAYDSPLAVVIGAQIVAKEQVHPEFFGTNDQFRAAVLKHYEKMIAEDIAIGKDQDRVHSMLRVLALIQPTVPDDRHVLELLSSVEDIDAPDASRLARLLIESGVLFKRGARFRLSPDLLADSIIETACVTSSGRSNGYAERVFTAASPEHKEHILINLGRLDWRRNDGDTSASVLLDGLWGQLVWEGDYQRSQVKAAAAAAYYQPRQALAFASRLVDEGHGRDEDVCRIVRNAAYTLKFVPDACALLWEAGRGDARATNSHPNHPIRLLAELATPEPRKPAEFAEKAVEHALSLVDDPESWAGSYSPFDVLRGGLATEGHFTSSSSNRAITISQYLVQRDRVTTMRKLIVAELFTSLGSANARRAFLAALTLGDALRGPIGARGGDRDDWGDEFVDTLARLEVYVDSTKISAPVLVRVAESVHWHAFYGPERTRLIAQRLIAKLDRDIETRTVRALIDAWGTSTWPTEKETGRPQHEADVNALSGELKDRFAQPAALAHFLDARLADIKEATATDGGPGQLFIGRLLVQNPELALYVVKRRLEGDTTLLTAHAGRALGALLTARHDEGTHLITEMLGGGNALLQVVAESYMFATHPATYSDVDLTALRCIFGSEDATVLRYTPNIALEVSRHDKTLAIDLLSSANIDLALRSAPDYFIWLVHDDTIPFSLIGDDQLRRLLDGLRNVPRLDDHWVNAFLKKAIGRVPDAVLELAKTRIDASIARSDWSMQPLGSVFDDRNALDLPALPEGGALLRSVLDWALDRMGDFQFCYRFAELVQSLCSPYDTTCVAILEGWLTEGGTPDHFKVVAAIISDAGPRFISDHADFISRSLRAARSISRNVHKELSSAIFASSVSGIRSGVPGQPFDSDLRLKQLAQERLERITRADPTYELYLAIRDHATRDIERQVADGRRMDEEDADA